jgi:hypothetical protein
MSNSGFNRHIYDICDFQQRVADSTAPLYYKLYRGQGVNCNRCHVNQDKYISLVDMESEMKNITRIWSSCNQFKYHPSCKFSRRGPNSCVSTFDKFAPINVPPEVCPDAEAYLYFNHGLTRPTHPGFYIPDTSVCKPNTVVYPNSMACPNKPSFA